MASEKCTVRDGKFVEPCRSLAEVSEYGNPRGKQKGVFAWALYVGREPSRTFFGVKSGEWVQKGMAFNYCPFCGEKINAPYIDEFVERAQDNGGNGNAA